MYRMRILCGVRMYEETVYYTYLCINAFYPFYEKHIISIRARLTFSLLVFFSLVLFRPFSRNTFHPVRLWAALYTRCIRSKMNIKKTVFAIHKLYCVLRQTIALKTDKNKWHTHTHSPVCRASRQAHTEERKKQLPDGMYGIASR